MTGIPTRMGGSRCFVRGKWRAVPAHRFSKRDRWRYRIVSVYPILKRSVREKMKAKKKALGQVGRIPERIVGSKTPEQLTIAEYLAAQGSGRLAAIHRQFMPMVRGGARPS